VWCCSKWYSQVGQRQRLSSSWLDCSGSLELQPVLTGCARVVCMPPQQPALCVRWKATPQWTPTHLRTSLAAVLPGRIARVEGAP
jgi:hypothetical protein